MKLERILQINVVTLVALGALLLGMSQQNTFVTMLAIFAAMISFTVTDVLCLFRLKTIFANIAGIIAVVVCLVDFVEGRQKGEQLLAVANLLVYLQVVLLFQEKDNRLYGHLLVLSLLQVVVAAALGLDLRFGSLLVLYMFTAISALCLFYLYRELKFHGRQSVGETSTGEDVEMRTGVTYVDLTSALTIGSMARCILNMGIITLVFAFGLFFVIPRHASNPWHAAQSGQQMLGFSPEIELNEVGRMMQSHERVMRVKFRDHTTGLPCSIAGEPYFRGTVLSGYLFDDAKGIGRWRQSTIRAAQRQDIIALDPVPPSHDSIRQDIVLAPRQDNIVFSIYPPYRSVLTRNELGYDVKSHRLVRKEIQNQSMVNQFRYTLLTTAFVSGWQDPIVPLRDGDAEVLTTDELKDLTLIDRKRHPFLSQLADNLCTESDNAEGGRIAQVRILESHFRNSDLYNYSLDFGPVQLRRTPGVDPIEDFVANHRTGHCEYFASALTLMLRSQGIPARLVVGYLGGDYNSVGKYYQVRQAHAHAWVEAYLEAGDLSQVVGSEVSATWGAWMRLDPTPPSAGIISAVAQTPLFSRVLQWLEYTEVLWNEYVVGLNSERQYRSIYQPLVQHVRHLCKALLAREMWSRLLENIVNGKWFHWRAGLCTAAILLIVSGMVRFLREPLQQFMETFRGWRRPLVTSRQIGFQMRLESILNRHGWQRRNGQTQHEFAREVGSLLADDPTCRAIALFPSHLVDAFYRVRFGGHVLDVSELRSLEAGLDELATALAGRGFDHRSVK